MHLKTSIALAFEEERQKNLVEEASDTVQMSLCLDR